MATVRITSGRTGKTFDVKVFDTYSLDLDMPITAFKLPEQNSSKAQLIKVEGNFKTLTFSWVLNEDGNDVSSDASNIITVEQQRDYLETEFETFGLADGQDTIVVLGTSPLNSKTGKLVKILLSLDALEPNNYRATLSLFTGETVITAEDN